MVNFGRSVGRLVFDFRPSGFYLFGSPDSAVWVSPLGFNEFVPVLFDPKTQMVFFRNHALFQVTDILFTMRLVTKAKVRSPKK